MKYHVDTLAKFALNILGIRECGLFRLHVHRTADLSAIHDAPYYTHRPTSTVALILNGAIVSKGRGFASGEFMWSNKEVY